MNNCMLFFRYAFPCLQVHLDMGRITQEEYDHLKELYFSGEHPDKKELEKIFPEALRRMKDKDRDYCNKKSIRDYFILHHNKLIDNNDGNYKYFPESFKKLCKVRVVKVKKAGKFILADKKYISTIKAKSGDLVSVHLGFAVENLTENNLEHYSKQ